MSRSSRLLFHSSLEQIESAKDTEILGVSDEGIPIGWLFCFGGRNFWSPDDKVADRGGTMAKRERLVTPLEVADARLLNAIDSLRDIEHLWVWFAALQMLRRRLMARGTRGILRIEAPWALEDEKQRTRLHQALAFAENYVHYASAGYYASISSAADPLTEFAPFVPVCKPDDMKQFRKAKGKSPESDAQRAAELLVGLPGKDPERFGQTVQSQYAEDFAKIESLSPYPATGGDGAGAKKEEKPGLFKRLFGKKK